MAHQNNKIEASEKGGVLSDESRIVVMGDDAVGSAVQISGMIIEDIERRDVVLLSPPGVETARRPVDDIKTVDTIVEPDERVVVLGCGSIGGLAHQLLERMKQDESELVFVFRASRELEGGSPSRPLAYGIESLLTDDLGCDGMRKPAFLNKTRGHQSKKSRRQHR
jgi:hypothetical protein